MARTRPLLAALALASAAPLSAQQSLTIYNDGRVLMRQSFDAKVPSGTSRASVNVGAADPASVFALDPGVSITHAVFEGTLSEDDVMRRAVGKEIRFVVMRPSASGAVADTIRVTVLSVDPLRLKLPDGSITFHMPGQALYPAELAGGAPTLALDLSSKSALDRLRLGYFTSGARWSAGYAVILDRSSARVSGTAALSSDALAVQDADVQLLAGDVGNASAPQPPRPLYARAEAAKVADAVGAVEQRVGEFHLYTLTGKQTLKPGQTTLASLFAPVTTPYDRMYLVRGSVPYWGYLPQTGDEGDVPVNITYTLKRERKTPFGEAPLPAGVARVYQADDAGQLQLVGEAGVDHTPAGEDLRLDAGTAFDLTAKRVQTSYTTRRDSTRGTWRTTATADYRVTISNATDSAVTVVVEERRAGEWSVVSSSVPAEKTSSTATRFSVKVPARGDAALTYRIRAIW
ncbi:MAG TPA: hypothetical protein VFI41_03370 [Gemmatimonadales bacterium]|nr:hypothetical protein [Gemmatimonadales bacterium]